MESKHFTTDVCKYMHVMYDIHDSNTGAYDPNIEAHDPNTGSSVGVELCLQLRV